MVNQSFSKVFAIAVLTASLVAPAVAAPHPQAPSGSPDASDSSQQALAPPVVSGAANVSSGTATGTPDISVVSTPPSALTPGATPSITPSIGSNDKKAEHGAVPAPASGHAHATSAAPSTSPTAPATATSAASAGPTSTSSAAPQAPASQPSADAPAASPDAASAASSNAAVPSEASAPSKREYNEDLFARNSDDSFELLKRMFEDLDMLD
ncbi:hypothetical protein ABKN59_006664 [Abortiporus biennis]